MNPTPVAKPKFNMPPLSFILTGVLFLMLLVGVVYLFTLDTDGRATLLEISPESMTAEYRAQEVSEWTRDVVDNIKPSETRNSFVQTVEAAAKDNVITADEYVAASDLYNELRKTAYIDDINNSLMKMRAHDDMPALLDTDTAVELDDNNFVDISEGEADITGADTNQ